MRWNLKPKAGSRYSATRLCTCVVAPPSARVTCPLTSVQMRSSRSPQARGVADMRKSKFTEEQMIGFIKQPEASAAA